VAYFSTDAQTININDPGSYWAGPNENRTNDNKGYLTLTVTFSEPGSNAGGYDGCTGF
jgi:hypothetical protein